MALKLKTKVLVPPKPPDLAENSATSASIGENSFRKHLYNQTVVSGWYVLDIICQFTNVNKSMEDFVHFFLNSNL